MKLEFVEIQNFRKLKSCRIDFSDTETLFVGANNSGKTSAMDALILFLKDKSKFTTRDFTISNWGEVNKIGSDWIEIEKELVPDLSIDIWNSILPQIDIWLDVKKEEIHYVNHLIPTLRWREGLLGMRLSFEPQNTEELYTDFIEEYNASQKVLNKKDGSGSTLKLWPKSLWDFLERKLHNYFKVSAYLLDPNKIQIPNNGHAQPQTLPNGSVSLEKEPLKGLLKINIINAQRGFTDPNADSIESSNKTIGNLSSQLRNYYKKHLNPFTKPQQNDIEALEAIDTAQLAFNKKLKDDFKSSLGELEDLNYPGFGNPSIKISSKVNPIDGLNHEASVLFDLLDDKEAADTKLHLPEKYNGLGYQNLISMVFKLIGFRDDWMQVGKIDTEIEGFEPIHLVLIEEPEAHLHAQVQQVFIRKAYEVLRKNKFLQENSNFKTQLIVSTHSNHVAHEVDFIKLRYFKREIPNDKRTIPTSTIINLTSTFGPDNETTKFATRYLKTTHCDLFFADAVILVEGPAERMLIPHFIKRNYPSLRSTYISILEIGGSHAHRLKPLIDDLGIITLIITDIDSIDPNSKAAVLPELNKKYESSNSTIKDWTPKIKDFDALIQLKDGKKITPEGLVRVAYQTEVMCSYEGKNVTILPYTFEDSLAFSNKEVFEKHKGIALMGKITTAIKKEDPNESRTLIFEALKKGKKAEFALELLYLEEPSELITPDYIAKGLGWLEDKLKESKESLK